MDPRILVCAIKEVDKSNMDYPVSFAVKSFKYNKVTKEVSDVLIKSMCRRNSLDEFITEYQNFKKSYNVRIFHKRQLCASLRDVTVVVSDEELEKCLKFIGSYD